MAEPRNNIYRHYPRRCKAQLVRWRELEGKATGEIIQAAAAAWPELPVIHHTTWRRWNHSAEYRELRNAILEEGDRNRRLDTMWAAVADGQADDVAQGTMYLLLHRAFEMAEGEEVSPKELRSLVGAVSDAQRAEIARAKQERDATVAQCGEQHAAEIAELQRTIEAQRKQINDQQNSLARKAGNVDPARRREIIESVDEFVRGAQR